MLRPKKIIRLPRSAGMSKSRVMAIYRNHVKKLHANRRPVFLNQVRNIIGTDNTWFNARVINRDPAWVVVNNASYVWNAQNLNREFAVISKTFRIRRNIRRARLLLSVDNYAVVLINGRTVVFDAPQNTPSFYNPGRRFNIRRFLRRGVNDIVIVAFNFGGPPTNANPAGVAARLNITLA